MAHDDLRARLPELNDVELCTLVCRGSDPAFEEITHRYKGLIRLIAKEYSYPGFELSDFMQLGLMVLYNACRTYSTQSGVSFKNYAAICIKRRFMSLVRSLTAQKAIPADAVVPVQDIALYSENTNPEALIDLKESNADFLSLVKSRLSLMELSVLKGYINGLSYNDIAESLGLDRKAVDNALVRARKKLLK